MSDVIADLAVQLSINDVDDSAITNLQSAIDSMADKTVDISTNVDTAPITDAESTINSLQDSTIDVATNVDTSALDTAKATIDDISTSPIDVTTDVDTSALDNVNSEISNLDGQTIDVAVNSTGMTQLRMDLAEAKAQLNGIGPASKSNLGGLENDALGATIGTKSLKTGLMDAKKETSSLRTAITSLTGSGSGLSRELVAPLKSVGSMAGVAAVQSTVLGSVLGGLGPATVPAIVGIAAIGTGLVAAGLFSGTFRDTLGQVVTVAQTLGGHLSTAFSDLTKGNITGAINEVKTGFIGAYDSLRSMDWGGILSKIGTETLSGIKNAITEAFNFLMGVDWGGVGNQIVNGLKTIGTGLQNIFTDAYNYLKNVDWGGAWNIIVSGASKIGDAIQKGFEDAYNYLKSVDWGGIWNTIVSGASKIGDAIKAIDWGGIWSSITSGANNIGESILAAIKSVDWNGVWNQIATGAVSIGNAIKNSITSIDWGGALSGLETAFSSVGSSGGAGSLSSSIVDSIKSVDWGGVFNYIVAGLAHIPTQIAQLFEGVDWTSVGHEVGTLFGQAIILGITTAITATVSITSMLAGMFAGSGGSAGAAGSSAGKDYGSEFASGANGAAQGFGDAIKEQLSRITINWPMIAGDFGAFFSAVGDVIGAHITVAIETAINALGIPGLHVNIDPNLVPDADAKLQSSLSGFSNLTTAVTVTPDMSKMEPALTSALGGVHSVTAQLANSGELHASAASAVIGPHPTTATLTNGSQILIQTAASIIGPHSVNGQLANGLTLMSQTASSIVGPHQTNANLANSGTVTGQTAAAIIGPHAANATVTSVDTAALQNMAGSAHADVTSFTNLLGTISLPATAYITAVTGTLSAAQALLRGEGGIVKASEGFVTRGPQLVLAGDNPGGQEAFVPLRHGKIPIEGGTGGGTVNHYHLNLSGLITEPITEETLITLFKRMEQMQGAAYQ